MGSFVLSTILNDFPITSRGLTQITCKVQLNGDPQEEIFHHYTYAMSALGAPTDFMWAAGIYFRDHRVLFLFQLPKKLSLRIFAIVNVYHLFASLNTSFNTNSSESP